MKNHYMELSVAKKNSLKYSLLFGAIGDALGSRYENSVNSSSLKVDFNSFIQTTDDTELTLKTLEVILEIGKVDPEKIANGFLDSYKKRKIRGIGSSTLKAMRELELGQHWCLSGMGGEYSAGNGAAMRISPLAYFLDIDFDRTIIRDLVSITHKNEEAYCGALAILYSIRYAYSAESYKGELINYLINFLFDSRLRDRLIEINSIENIELEYVAEKYGNGGYVVESVPLSVMAAKKYMDGSLTFTEIITKLIKCGGDTDTICSMAGNIIGACRKDGILNADEKHLIEKLKTISEYERIMRLMGKVE